MIDYGTMVGTSAFTGSGPVAAGTRGYGASGPARTTPTHGGGYGGGQIATPLDALGAMGGRAAIGANPRPLQQPMQALSALAMRGTRGVASARRGGGYR